MNRGRDIVTRKKSPLGDFYETPAWATQALLEREFFHGSILEPACGSGAIVKVLRRHYPQKTIHSFDLRMDEDVLGLKGIDFLGWNPGCEIANIITNPPYKLALEFARHALGIVEEKVALLLRLTFLESARRYKFFQVSPLSIVYVFSSRLTMYPAGVEKPKNTGTAAYAWFIWDKRSVKEPIIRWIGSNEQKRVPTLRTDR